MIVTSLYIIMLYKQVYWHSLSFVFHLVVSLFVTFCMLFTVHDAFCIVIINKRI